MKRFLLGLTAAVIVHLLILLFGGIFFLGSDESTNKLSVDDVEIVSADEPEQKQPDETELEQRDPDQVESPPEKPPEMTQLVAVEPEPLTVADATPELAALSLAALESALGEPGGGEFGSSYNLTSGGRIGGTGTPGSDESGEATDVFSLADLDESPRPLSQAAPAYPIGLQQRKVEGVVTVVFIVDAQGRVIEPVVERSTDPGFEPPALEAVRRWKFEPATRNGKKVPTRLRIPIRFSLNS